ncbi:MAG: hypothetical protein ACRDY6_03830 [Acidimicrobiia bacterium]
MSAPRRLARLATLVVTLAAVWLAAGATPASAQQIIDAGGGDGEGGLAFIAFTVMMLIIAGSLFYMDRIRRRREESDGPREPPPG